MKLIYITINDIRQSANIDNLSFTLHTLVTATGIPKTKQVIYFYLVSIVNLHNQNHTKMNPLGENLEWDEML